MCRLEIFLRCLILVYYIEETGLVSGDDTLRPVWQWVDPTEPDIFWPPSRSQGEVKACTCSFVNDKGFCIDSAAKGYKASFPCGLTNTRNRAGSNEKVIGMRQDEIQCYCSYNQGTE